MALQTNQRGYDVISAVNERISVKTITSSAHVSLNADTLEFVDRVMVLRVNVDDENGTSVEEITCVPQEEFVARFLGVGDRLSSSTHRPRPVRPLEDLRVAEEVPSAGFLLRKYENRSILVMRDGLPLSTAKPTLREIAAAIGVDLLNGRSQPTNTRQLGSYIMRTLTARATGVLGSPAWLLLSSHRDWTATPS